MEEQLRTLDRLTEMALEMAVRFGPKLVVAVAILVAGYIVGGWAGRAVSRSLRRLQFEPPVRALVEKGVRLFVLGLFLILALQNLGVELLPLIAGLGVAGAGIALAMQGVLSNVVAAIRGALGACPLMLKEPAPVVGVSRLADSAVTVAVKPWAKVTDYGAAVAQVNQAVLQALRARNVEIPFPQREVRVVSDAVLRKSADDRLAGRDAA